MMARILILLLVHASVLWSKPSEFNGKVLVVQEGNYRILRFADEGKTTEQSRCDITRSDYLVHEYTRLQLLGLAYAQNPKKVLVIGLGGGSLSKALARILPEAQIDSVEIDPVVVEAARKFFFYQESPRIRTFTEDATRYVKRDTRYDIVFLDAFDGLDVPEPLRTQKFYRELKTDLVVANFHRNSDTYATDRNTLQSVFPHSYAYGGVGNVLIVASKEERAPDYRERADYDLKALAAKRIHPDEWDRSARILTE